MDVRPLDYIIPGDRGDQAATAESLTTMPSSADFAASLTYFHDYPARGLSTAGSRAYMYNLIRATQPTVFVEIGTYYAAMTEVVARAIWDNKKAAQIITIDPYGNDRVPGLIRGWPDALQELVSFLPLTSMDFFAQMRKVRPQIDVCFIDGDHSYEFALFDLNCAALWMQPGGIVIMDDYDQPGVFWATKHFLDLHPGWREIGGVFEAFDPGAPFASIRPSVPDTGFLILKAPDAIEVAGAPKVFEIKDYQSIGISGIDFTMLPGHGGGRIDLKIYMRSFYRDPRNGDPEQKELTFSDTVEPDNTSHTMTFDAPLRSSYDPNRASRELEINMVWTPTQDRQALNLAADPHPIPAQ